MNDIKIVEYKGKRWIVEWFAEEGRWEITTDWYDDDLHDELYQLVNEELF